MIGRKTQQRTLLELEASKESEFAAVYGRRRIGKTYLVRETFSDRFAFAHTGLANASTKQQLEEFRVSLENYGEKNPQTPKNWSEAFQRLKTLLQSVPKPGGKKIVLIDEMPWIDRPKSGFLAALEHFWNSWAAWEKDILLIACGSATSWIVNKVLRDHGGLHNRVTRKICLQPFTLAECEQMAQEMELPATRQDILEAYMVLGGVPYYWKLMDKALSTSQNIDRLIFSRNGELRDEAQNLFRSLFRAPQGYLKVIEALASHKAGMTREEIASQCGLTSSGNLTHILDELELCDFIRKYTAPGKKNKGSLYQLTDNFTLFHFRFARDYRGDNPDHWSQLGATQKYAVWAGLAFERVCLLHSAQIKAALGISGIVADVYAWSRKPDQETGTPGAQIDLLIDRMDNVVNICEMKYTQLPYTVTPEYSRHMEQRAALFVADTKTRKTPQLVLISANGVTPNAYAKRIPKILSTDDLFNS